MSQLELEHDVKMIHLSPIGGAEEQTARIRIPFKIKEGSGNTLVVLFHGSMKRDQRPFPFFQPFFPVPAHQISISDPTMFADPLMTTGWYLGSEGDDLPKHLSSFILEQAARLECTRRVYVGGSAGGFAALLYSNLDPGSIAIAANPQTNLKSYFIPSGIERLRRVCWPSADNLENFSHLAPLDLSNKYAQGFDNHVIYIQSTGDHEHVHGQLVPFMSSIDSQHAGRVILDIGSWGIPGHSGSAPPQAWLPWLKATLTARTWSSKEILEIRHSLAVPNLQIQNSSADKSVSPADIRFATMLSQFELARD
jgi:hypothetical protein